MAVSKVESTASARLAIDEAALFHMATVALTEEPGGNWHFSSLRSSRRRYVFGRQRVKAVGLPVLAFEISIGARTERCSLGLPPNEIRAGLVDCISGLADGADGADGSVLLVIA